MSHSSDTNARRNGTEHTSLPSKVMSDESKDKAMDQNPQHFLMKLEPMPKAEEAAPRQKRDPSEPDSVFFQAYTCAQESAQEANDSGDYDRLLFYAEGYATDPIGSGYPHRHAWVVDTKGVAQEVAWDQMGCEYLPIRIWSCHRRLFEDFRDGGKLPILSIHDLDTLSDAPEEQRCQAIHRRRRRDVEGSEQGFDESELN